MLEKAYTFTVDRNSIIAGGIAYFLTTDIRVALLVVALGVWLTREAKKGGELPDTNYG